MKVTGRGNQVLFLGICALGAGLIGAVFVGSAVAEKGASPKKVVHKPKFAAKKVTIDMVATNAKPAIPFKAFTLADFPSKDNNVLPETEIAL